MATGSTNHRAVALSNALGLRTNNMALEFILTVTTKRSTQLGIWGDWYNSLMQRKQQSSVMAYKTLKHSLDQEKNNGNWSQV